jgi:hypothetical protein
MEELSSALKDATDPHLQELFCTCLFVWTVAWLLLNASFSMLWFTFETLNMKQWNNDAHARVSGLIMTLHQIESTIATAAEDKLVEARQRGVKYSPKDTGLLGSRALKRSAHRLCLGFFLACASDVVPNGFYVCGFYVPRIVAFQVRGCESSLTLWLPCVASKCLLMWLLIVVSKWCLALRLPM